jgi:TPR repeat protein
MNSEMSRLSLLAVFLCFLVVLPETKKAVADDLPSGIQALIPIAESGDPEAQFRVGSAYDIGREVPQDIKEALKWYRMAAEQGHAAAQNNVGSLLQAEKRYLDALQWYERAAAQGHPGATNSMAYLYELGLGVKQDRRKGFELYSRAADLGSAAAMRNMAETYREGQLGKTDLVMACIWTTRALRFAHPNHEYIIAPASRTMSQLKKTLSPAELTTCTQQGNEWRPNAANVELQR